MKFLPIRSAALAAGLVLACAWLGSGCRSAGQAGSTGFASVTIKSRTTQQIRDTTMAVFRENGYAGPATASQPLVFAKAGSRLDTLSRDGVVAMQGGASSLIRVKVELARLDQDSHLLECQAFTVSGAGDSFFEEEHRLANVRSGPYQSLLNEVARRLK